MTFTMYIKGIVFLSRVTNFLKIKLDKDLRYL